LFFCLGFVLVGFKGGTMGLTGSIGFLATPLLINLSVDFSGLFECLVGIFLILLLLSVCI